MLTATSGANHTFIYTADGERVSDRVGSTKTITIRDLSNKVLRIYAYNGSAWSWSKDYVYREGQLLATVEPPFASQVTKHVHLDHLGTPRRITNSSRAIIATHDYYPFGMEACGTADGERMKFTGHELDGQGTGSQTDDLAYMHARYYNANIARFLSVDLVGGRREVPQSWGRYSYALGSPVSLLDPDGNDARLYVTVTFNPALQPEIMRQTRTYAEKQTSAPGARLSLASYNEGQEATSGGFRAGLSDTSGVSFYVGHASLVAPGKVDGLLFPGPSTDRLDGARNRNAIVFVGACASSQLASKFGVSSSNMNQAFVGIGDPAAGSRDLARVMTALLGELNKGATIQQAVDYARKQNPGLSIILVTGNPNLKIEADVKPKAPTPKGSDLNGGGT
jgi:RHS repeat-associated protein